MALVFVGPEAPLCAGLADALNAKGVPCFGPTQLAAELEVGSGTEQVIFMSFRIVIVHFCWGIFWVVLYGIVIDFKHSLHFKSRSLIFFILDIDIGFSKTSHKDGNKN